MTTEDLTQQALALPPAERLHLAQALWESLAAESADEVGQLDGQDEAVRLAQQRDAELASGMVETRTHEQVMDAVQRLLK
jgi:putative addiction module component (TIGR02574 family)